MAKKENKEVKGTISQERIKESFADNPEKMSDYTRGICIFNKLSNPREKFSKEDIDHLINCYDVNTLNPAAVISLQLNDFMAPASKDASVFP